MEEALGLVREGGLAALSLREATRRAGVTPGAAYRHFRGRDELVAAAAREIQDRMAEGMRAAAGANGAGSAEAPGADDEPDRPTGEDPGGARLGTGAPVSSGATGGQGSAGHGGAESLRAPAVPPAERALARLRGVGLGYLAFARAEPGWFETVFFGGGFGRGGGALSDAAESASGELEAVTGGPGETSSGQGAMSGGPRATAGEPAVAPPFAELVAALDACRDAGVLPPERRVGAEFVCWSAVHGCAELMIHGPLRGADPAHLDALAARVVDDIIAGVRGPQPGGPDA